MPKKSLYTLGRYFFLIIVYLLIRADVGGVIGVIQYMGQVQRKIYRLGYSTIMNRDHSVDRQGFFKAFSVWPTTLLIYIQIKGLSTDQPAKLCSLGRVFLPDRSPTIIFLQTVYIFENIFCSYWKIRKRYIASACGRKCT